eukprot:Pgem_evm1s7324
MVITHITQTTVILHEHNRLCNEFALLFPNLSDDELYKKAKTTVHILFTRIIFENYGSDH